MRIDDLIQPVAFKIWNSSGQMVQKGILSEQLESVDVQSLPPGLYLFQVNGVQGGIRFMKE